MKSKLSRRLLHPLCLIGSFVALVGLGASVVALAVDLVAHDPHAYQGLLTFVLYPVVMFSGIVLIVTGLLLERRRARKLEIERKEWRPILDPGLARHRRILVAMFSGMVVFGTASILGAYRAFQFTESDEFCGQLCHTAMQPEYETHRNSPHARIDCVACHVGPGATGYIEAKISGLHQLYGVISGSYARPIRVHPEKIPGADDTCERCHWREKFWGQSLDTGVRFGFDLRNTRRSVRLVLDTGGGSSTYGRRQGIHWHANAENRVWFRSTDPFRREVVQVRVRRADGSETVYERQNGDESGGDESDEPGDLDALPEHLMTCRDCHNRPAHRFLTPEQAVDFALETGEIQRSLPFIKKVLVDALGAEYATVDRAMDGIRERVEGYYRDHFEGVVLARKESLEQAIEVARGIYRRNVFPEMKVDGYTYPDHSGHRNFPGCLRCHDGKLVSAAGEVLPRDCDLCHRVLEAASGAEGIREVPVSTAMLHPWTSEKHDEIQCWTCHAGNVSPYAGCTSCHEDAAGDGHPMSFECSICHRPERPADTGGNCNSCHPTGGSPLHQHAEHRDCLKCHRPHSWKLGYPGACSSCHERVQDAPLAEHHPGMPCSPCHKFEGVESSFAGLAVGDGGK